MSRKSQSTARARSSRRRSTRKNTPLRLPDNRPVDFARYDVIALLSAPEGVAREGRECNLSGAILTGLDLSGVDFSGARLVHTSFVDCNLTNARFRDAHCYGADFSGAILKDTDFYNACVASAKFEHAQLDGVELSYADASETSWRNASVTNPFFTGTRLGHASFERAKLKNVRFDFAELGFNDWKGCKLMGVSFHGARAIGVAEGTRPNGLPAGVEWSPQGPAEAAKPAAVAPAPAESPATGDEAAPLRLTPVFKIDDSGHAVPHMPGTPDGKKLLSLDQASQATGDSADSLTRKWTAVYGELLTEDVPKNLAADVATGAPRVSPPAAPALDPAPTAKVWEAWVQDFDTAMQERAGFVITEIDHPDRLIAFVRRWPGDKWQDALRLAESIALYHEHRDIADVGGFDLRSYCRLDSPQPTPMQFYTYKIAEPGSGGDGAVPLFPFCRFRLAKLVGAHNRQWLSADKRELKPFDLVGASDAPAEGPNTAFHRTVSITATDLPL